MLDDEHIAEEFLLLRRLQVRTLSLLLEIKAEAAVNHRLLIAIQANLGADISELQKQTREQFIEERDTEVEKLWAFLKKHEIAEEPPSDDTSYWDKHR
jgi:hypothetical protein